MKKTRRHGTRGGGYGFGGSILADAGGANAGSALWDQNTGTDCGVSSDRGGNGTFAGGRRRTRKTRRGGNVLNSSLAGRGGNNVAGGGKSKKKKREEAYMRRFRKRGGSITGGLNNRGGNGGSRKRGGSRGGNDVGADLAQMSPRSGYTFDGTGVGGTANTIPV
jgi:hypothetical protein